jgi:hypothetical protein
LAVKAKTNGASSSKPRASTSKKQATPDEESDLSADSEDEKPLKAKAKPKAKPKPKAKVESESEDEKPLAAKKRAAPAKGKGKKTEGSDEDEKSVMKKTVDKKPRAKVEAKPVVKKGAKGAKYVFVIF